jgi:hypothetical protein
VRQAPKDQGVALGATVARSSQLISARIAGYERTFVAGSRFNARAQVVEMLPRLPSGSPDQRPSAPNRRDDVKDRLGRGG